MTETEKQRLPWSPTPRRWEWLEQAPRLMDAGQHRQIHGRERAVTVAFALPFLMERSIRRRGD